MRIAVIGAGSVGGTLGRRWAEAGHDVVFGVPDPASPKAAAAVAAARRSRAASVAEAAAGAEVVVLATPWEAAEAAIRTAGNLAGKVLVDATNPLAARAAGLATGPGTSGAEAVAGWAAGARVVKAFNTIGFEIMADPSFPGGVATLLLCGDDAGAKATVSRLAEELGFEPVDLGPLAEARLVEPFALVWIRLAMFRGLGRGIAFRLMKR